MSKQFIRGWRGGLKKTCTILGFQCLTYKKGKILRRGLLAGVMIAVYSTGRGKKYEKNI
jgi:hypothetical protein